MKKTTVALAMILSLFFAVNAFCAESIYPGAMGVTKSSSDPVPMREYGTIKNPSTTTAMTVILPIKRSNRITGYGITSAYVDVIDQSSTSNITCTLYATNQTSSACPFTGYSSTKSSSSSACRRQRLDFGTLDTLYISHAYFECTIPAGGSSSIISYFVQD